jgi:hypothetical protein
MSFLYATVSDNYVFRGSRNCVILSRNCLSQGALTTQSGGVCHDDSWTVRQLQGGMVPCHQMRRMTPKLCIVMLNILLMNPYHSLCCSTLQTSTLERAMLVDVLNDVVDSFCGCFYNGLRSCVSACSVERRQQNWCSRGSTAQLYSWPRMLF